MFALLSFLLAMALGILITSLLVPDARFVERLALGYGIGLGLATLVMFCLSAVSIVLSAQAIATALAFAVLAFGAILWRYKPGALVLRAGGVHPRDKSDFHRFYPWKRALTLVIAITVLLTTLANSVIALYWPIRSWDAVAIWGVKGKAIAASGTITSLEYGAHPYYPLHWPLMISLASILDGDKLVKALLSLTFAALLAVFYSNLRRFCGLLRSWLATLALATTPFLLYHSTIAYANLTMSFYYTASVLYLLNYFHHRKLGSLLLSGLMAGIATWTRPEGLLLLGLNLLVLLIFSLRRKLLRSSLLYILPPCCFVFPWIVYSKYILNISNPFWSYTVTAITSLLTSHVDWDKLATVLQYLGRTIGAYGQWGGVWIAFLVIVALCIDRVKRHSYLLSIIFLNIAMVVFMYYSTPEINPLSWWLKTGFNRMILHFFPLLVFAAALLTQENGA
ncbi:MAG TPA: hypothetical protein EYP49_13490 [Anaerolineae bacterium]|nr:hypothetical protein [Anaerolineae bacterium]